MIFAAVHEEQLPPQTGIPRVCGYGRTEGRTDSLTHFGCRCVGKGNQQQAVDIDRIVLVRQPPEHTLGQHGCLCPEPAAAETSSAPPRSSIAVC